MKVKKKYPYTSTQAFKGFGFGSLGCLTPCPPRPAEFQGGQLGAEGKVGAQTPPGRGS